MIDASTLNIYQVKFLAENEQHMFTKLDFARCDDEFIVNAIGNSASNSISIPLIHRQSAKLVREFFRFSRDARLILKKRDEEYLLIFQSTPVDRRCLYLVRSIMGVGSNVVWDNEEEEGYNSLIRS